MAREWYEDFFRGMALDLWREAIPLKQTRAEADFLEGVLGAGAGAKLLDVPCGNGRLACELARQGYAMTGVELAPEFIREARASARALGAAMEWRRGDMRDLPWRRKFDGAFCFGNSFGYFARNGICAFLKAVANSLKPGARFVLDTGMAAESILPGLETRARTRVGDMRVLVEHSYHVAESRLDTAYTFKRKGASETRSARHWIYTVGEIGHMLEAGGLEPISLFATLDQAPYHPGDKRLLLVAEKPAKRRNL